MTAMLTTTIGKTARKSTLRLLLSFLAIFLTATFFVACGDSDDEGGGGGGSGGGGGKGSSDYRKGIAAFEKKEYEDAVKSFKEAAEKGNAEAMVAYAACLEAGKGIEKDEEESEKWLKKAADTGDATSQAFYATVIKNRDKEKSFDYLKKSADQNNLFGQFFLGAAYLAERNEADAKKGLNYIRKVAERSLTKEKTVMDVFKDVEDVFSGAKGLDIDLPEDKKNVSNVMIIMSQTLLGAVYMEQKDLAEAKKWLRKAGDNGLSQADDLLKQVEKAEKESKSKKR